MYERRLVDSKRPEDPGGKRSNREVLYRLVGIEDVPYVTVYRYTQSLVLRRSPPSIRFGP